MNTTNTKLKEGKSDRGLWFLYFFIIYLVITLKVVTDRNISTVGIFEIEGIMVTTFILSRFFLAYFHKSPVHNPNYEPTISFVVPAKNEEDNIYKTLLKFIEVNYPLEKIEVIIVNDGSTDNTLSEMYRAQKDLQEKVQRVEVVNWEVNRGKRDGMAEGVKRSKNEIIIFIDSDSFIEPDCVKHLTKYFIDRKIGAVSGHTDVYNRDTNILTKMQAVRYYIAFNVYKAAESIFGNVTCCPGCCSAYRREYLLEFIDAWLNQTFLGKRCTYGDDRSLTNFMLRKYDATYSAEALAYTVVPDDFKKYIKQQQRWKKSWVRETFIASSFMWKRHPIAALFFYVYTILALLSPLILIRALFWYPFTTHTLPVIYTIGFILMLLLQGIYCQIRMGYKKWFFPVMFMWVNSVILIWQLPWAFITIRNTRWGTR